MRILGLNILSENELSNIRYECFIEGYDSASEYRRNLMIHELERLKQDHWDKEAFDRLIEGCRK